MGFVDRTNLPCHHCALLFMDLDNFKSLNDTLGHAMGDLLLQQVAERLVINVREGDTVARLGGDEFVVLLEDLSESINEALMQVEAVGKKILASINQNYQLNTYYYHCTSSIGITLFKGQKQTLDELLKQADIAMYQAKAAGRHRLRFFDQHMQDTISKRVGLERDLENASAENQFSLYYQPQVQCAHQIIGAEALIRWYHPQRGFVPPDVFIPLAEENGLILSIGHWVLETVCAQIKSWENGVISRDLIISVNVSARQFHEIDFVETVRRVLKYSGINPNRLKLELTETAVLDDIEDTIDKMNELHELGISFSMDDFGTGYSSLSYLSRLPMDQLKIDQSFVQNIGQKASDAVMVQTIIGMARNLGMQVIAEGVETEQQRDFLELNGCSQYQGYLFSKPVTIEQFELLLNKNSHK
jgi:diguanylate cyclase (GGDEF)-like protein